MIAQTNAVFVSDRISFLSDRLTLDLGLKEAMVSREGWNGLPGSTYRTGFNEAEPLPRMALRYRINAYHQVFANVTTNFLALAQSTLFATYDPSSGQVASAANTDLRPEYSIAEEVGWRYAGDRLIGSVTLFNYNFTNRRISTVLDLNGALIGGTINAGGQTSRRSIPSSGCGPGIISACTCPGNNCMRPSTTIFSPVATCCRRRERSRSAARACRGRWA
nr:TonB-dependent receptor [uncultured Lichenicoccus sp.]